MREKIKVALMVLLLFLGGCELFQQQDTAQHLRQDVTAVTQVVNDSADRIVLSTNTIEDSIIGIKQNTKEARVEAPITAPIMSNIDKNADNIAKETRKLKETSLDLTKAGVKLEISGRTIDDYVDRAIDAEKANEELIKENGKLNENIKSGLNRMLKWIVGGCLIGAGASAAMALFFGNVKGGLFGAATCIIIMTLAIAVGQYMAYIAIAGGLAVVITFAVLGYQLFVQKRAISDNVWTQEVVKKHLSSDLKEKIYGIGKETGQAGMIQSRTTQKIVKDIKNKLPRGWQIMKKD